MPSFSIDLDDLEHLRMLEALLTVSGQEKSKEKRRWVKRLWPSLPAPAQLGHYCLAQSKKLQQASLDPSAFWHRKNHNITVLVHLFALPCCTLLGVELFFVVVLCSNSEVKLGAEIYMRGAKVLAKERPAARSY